MWMFLSNVSYCSPRLCNALWWQAPVVQRWIWLSDWSEKGVFRWSQYGFAALEEMCVVKWCFSRLIVQTRSNTRTEGTLYCNINKCMKYGIPISMQMKERMNAERASHQCFWAQHVQNEFPRHKWNCMSAWIQSPTYRCLCIAYGCLLQIALLLMQKWTSVTVEAKEKHGPQPPQRFIIRPAYEYAFHYLWPWSTKAVISSRYICSNIQRYIVWVKIIIFIFCQKSLGYYVKNIFHEDIL